VNTQIIEPEARPHGKKTAKFLKFLPSIILIGGMIGLAAVIYHDTNGEPSFSEEAAVEKIRAIFKTDDFEITKKEVSETNRIFFVKTNDDKEWKVTCTKRNGFTGISCEEYQLEANR